MGRPALSPEDHALRGNEAHPTTVRNVSDIPAGRPKWGKITREERPCFKRICRLLAQRRHLTEGDREIIAVYAAAECRFYKFKEVLDREGWTVSTDEGTKDHPLAKHFYAAERTMVGILDRLGLSPTAKDKPKPAKPAEAEKKLDPMDELLQRHGPALVEFHVPEQEPDTE